MWQRIEWKVTISHSHNHFSNINKLSSDFCMSLNMFFFYSVFLLNNIYVIGMKIFRNVNETRDVEKWEEIKKKQKQRNVTFVNNERGASIFRTKEPSNDWMHQFRYKTKMNNEKYLMINFKNFWLWTTKKNEKKEKFFFQIQWITFSGIFVFFFIIIL